MRDGFMCSERLRRALAFLLYVAISAVPAAAERLPLRSYSVADGLPNDTINRIVRDSRGFLWFCTADGLSLFDGYRFVNYGTAEGLPHQNVTDLLETREGEYWVATYGGLARFHPRGSSADAGRMFTVAALNAVDTRARMLITLTQRRDGTIWAGAWGGLFQLRRTNGADELIRVDLQADEPPAVVDALREDRFGTMWIGADNGLYRLRPDGRVARYTKRSGLPDTFIHDLLEDREGRLWVATRNGGFFSLATTADETTPVVLQSFSAKNGFIDWIFDLAETSDGRLLAATNYGLIELPSGPGPSVPSVHTASSGFVYHEISALAEDRDGNLWLGTINGAMKVARGGFRTFTKEDGIYLVCSLFEARGDVHAFGYVVDSGRRPSAHLPLPAGVAVYPPRIGRFDGRGFTWLLPRLRGRYPSWSPRSFVLQARTGEWWIGTNNGLFMFPRVRHFEELADARPLAVYTMQHGLGAQVVNAIHEDARGDVWISSLSTSTSSPHGLARWDRATRSIRDLAATPGLPPLRDHLPVTFQEDRVRQMWIGFSPGGLARYAAGHVTFFTERHGLPPGTVNDLHLDAAGRLWIATARGGIGRLDDPSASDPAFITYSTVQGLSADRVVTITEDAQGRIYAGTGRGVDRIAPDTGRIRHFTAADGLAPGESVAALADRHGALWFSTRNGLSRLVPEAERSSQPSPVWINGLRVAGERWHISNLGEGTVDLRDLRPDRNQLQIDFVGVSFAPGETLRYQYKVEGANADWSTPNEQRTVHLAGLTSGAYTFLVRAINSDGVASPQPAIVRFTILAPTWRRAWFVGLVAAAAGGMLYSLYRYRVSKLVELERVRTRIASDLHDDIGSALSRIAVLSEVAHHEAGPAGPREQSRLSAIAGAARELLDSMSDIVWAINPDRDQVRDLCQRMRRFASDMFTARRIAFTFLAPKDERRLKVGADVRRHVFLIFKEAVNNVLRHSGCTQADLELRADGGFLALKVIDNGHGFDPAGESGGQGLRSMRDRAHLMGGELRVDSHDGRGTVISLIVPRTAKVKERNRRLRRTPV